MKETTPMGMNRTGMQMSPFDASAMRAAAPQTAGTIEDTTAVSETRGSYIAEAEPIGSVPLPGTVTGAMTAGMAMLTGKEPQVFLDKLGERLAFERTGTRLYDALIAKFEVLGDGGSAADIASLEKIREDEARHFAVVADAIESLGGDPTAETPSADLAGMESLGLLQVLTDPRTTFAQSLHAILIAEMSDHAGWEMLIALADEHQQASLVTEFTVALNEERDHLERVQQWYQLAILGKPLPQRTDIPVH
ncbi:MAG TPA: ferritin-like domain-containing protein [Paucimonas sp.]|nr:ferritin-like domain-containing protein [Paucimonas sp.]